MIYKNLHPKNTCSPVRQEGELITKSGLAYTPSDMFEMAKRGIPVTSANHSLQFERGQDAKSFDVPLDRVRGIDVATLWEESQIIKQRASKNYRNKYKELL